MCDTYKRYSSVYPFVAMEYCISGTTNNGPNRGKIPKIYEIPKVS